MGSEQRIVLWTKQIKRNMEYLGVIHYDQICLNSRDIGDIFDNFFREYGILTMVNIRVQIANAKGDISM